ncbi:hypothetical protein F5I97DRAFT_1804724 [Phlebopus sp. FC_14]|nr:hypothetical protein F5I97DRAFT_1804724 [Phlebopus sp. FC_14]
MAEIIDLTVSPRFPETIEILSDGDEYPDVGRQNPIRTPKRRRSKKRKKSKGLLSDGVDSSAQPSRDHTPTQRDARSGRKFSRRSASPSPQTTSPVTDESTLFFVDAVAAPVDLELEPPNAHMEDPVEASNELLLPSHVSVLGSGGDAVVPVKIVPPTNSSDDEDFIEYLDYEYGKVPGLVRYFEADAEEGRTKPSIFKCKNCGVEGDHKSYECPVQICLTCGARDEHSTRSCPISKICFTCGMKGHINKTCPNRFSRPAAAAALYDDCDRCGSKDHKMNECPTLWRIYQYVNDEERLLTKQRREDRSNLSIGQGGEGYIGTEEWCYNCANPGHFGDDCDELPHPSGFPVEPSAFGVHNIMSGPFYDPATEPERIRRGPREPQKNSILLDEWGMDPPGNVGKQGRNKDRERLEKRFREQEDDGSDWFSDARNVKNRDMAQKTPVSAPRGKAMKFGDSLKDAKPLRPPPSVSPSSRNGGPPSLLARIKDDRGTESFPRRFDRSDHSRGSQLSLRIRGAANDRGKYSRMDVQERDQRRDGERDKGLGREYGPRYKGGYIA